MSNDTPSTQGELTAEMLEVMRSEIAFAVKMNVNGKIDNLSSKIDDHNTKHEKDMERMMPVIEAFEGAQDDLRTARKGGRVVLWIAAAITSLGGAYLVIKQIFGS
jgi:hypothetical protein